MQRFWLKLFIVFSASLSSYATLAISLTSLLSLGAATPTLLAESIRPVQLFLTIDDSPAERAKITTLVNSLSVLFQKKYFVNCLNDFYRPIADERCSSLVKKRVDSYYKQALLQ